MSVSTIPGPHETPIVGSLFKMADDPIEFMGDLVARFGPMVRFSLLGRPMVLIADPALAQKVLVEYADVILKGERDRDILAKFTGINLLTDEGAPHRKRRKLMAPAFHYKRVQDYGAIMTRYTAEQIAPWRDGDRRDMSEEMMQLTMFIVSKTLFDVDRADLSGWAGKVDHAVELLQKVMDEDFAGFDLFPEWVPTRRHRERKESKSILGETISRILAKRRSEAVNGELPDHGDLLSMILAARDEHGQPLDDENVRSELLGVFLAGHETTSNALSWMWYLLAKHPDIEAKLHGEIDQVLGGRLPVMADLPQLRYTLQVVKESIRLYPPAWALFGREPSEDVELGGHRIAKGTHIIISPYFIHRRAESFPDPERFDPDRFTPEREAQLPKYAYMPFAAGPHVCIGNQFALMEAQLLTATIAQRFTMRLAPDAQVAMSPRVTLGLTHGLPMLLRERRPAGDQFAKPAATPMAPELAPA